MKKIFIVLVIISLVSCKPEEKPVNNDWYARILDSIYYDVGDGGGLVTDGRTFEQRFEQISPDMISGSFGHIIGNIDYVMEGGVFELPVSGATGYAAVELSVYEAARIDNRSRILALSPGRGFTILYEENDWWYIEVDHIRGWVMHRYCLINLPDIIPSIVYNITNTYYSLFRTSGLAISYITGAALYEGKDFNVRLGREEYISAVLYSMAPKIFAAQQAALAQGNTLVIYEAFRPAEAHNEVHRELSTMVESNPLVMDGVTANSFSMSWFLATAPYNHQRGTAIDVSLGRITGWETGTTGSYTYVYITGHSEYPMQTQIHELSVQAAIFSPGTNPRSTTAWRTAWFSSSVTDGTILLIKYCSDAGLTPLASEWWHFNDLEGTEASTEMKNEGKYEIPNSYSRAPGQF